MVFFQVPAQRTMSSQKDIPPRPAYGRRQYENTRNNPSAGAPRSTFGSYNQMHGTIAASKLDALRGRNWNV